MVRQLQPWYASIGARQVRASKIYLRDTGLLHALLGLPDWAGLLAHPSRRPLIFVTVGAPQDTFGSTSISSSPLV
jgi:predicted AAA+ superfamily ATPase